MFSCACRVCSSSAFDILPAGASGTQLRYCMLALLAHALLSTPRLLRESAAGDARAAAYCTRPGELI